MGPTIRSPSFLLESKPKIGSIPIKVSPLSFEIKRVSIRIKDINYAKKEVKRIGFKIKNKLLDINKNTDKLIILTDFLMQRTS